MNNRQQAVLVYLYKQMRANCPVNTGHLRDSIKIKGSRVVVEAEYASAVEYGTLYTDPQPFMRPAIAKTMQAMRGNNG